MSKQVELSWKIRINFSEESVRIKSVETVWRSFEDAVLETQVHAAQLKSTVFKKPRQKTAWLNYDVKNGTKRLLQMGRLIESFSQGELVNIIAMLALKTFVMEDLMLENLGALRVSKQAHDKEELIDVFSFFCISKHKLFPTKKFWKLNCVRIRWKVLMEEIIV